MGEILVFGVLLGAGGALSVGPIFVTIVQEAATRGFGSGFQVSLGSAVANLVFLVPALAFSWLITGVAGALTCVAFLGTGFLIYLGWDAVVTARRLWSGSSSPPASPAWSFWKGVTRNLANPLTWTFWLTMGPSAMLRARAAGGWVGLVAFTLTWLAVAVAVEAVVAGAAARLGHAVGPKGLAICNGAAAVTFLALAGILLLSQ